MASALIHISVAKEANKILQKNEKEFILGSIAPDIAKQIGKKKKDTHFINGDNNVPDLEAFLLKYKDSLDNSFNLGYYCHLFTDFLWYGFYVLKYQIGETLYYRDGHSKEMPFDEVISEVYQEYTNLNIKLIERYNLDLSLFYEEAPIIKSNIEEIPIDNIKIIIDQMGIIIENSEKKENVLYDINSIDEFVQFTVKAFIKHLKEIKIL
ncbi:MAG: zinc dependent phospholipase C family protein [Bacilli bacterium]|nr:zinc dependent phospholipase C family protein [Bacilli bacterium]